MASALITGYLSLDGVIFVTIAIISVYMYMTRKFLYWENRGVAHTPPTPFIGNFGDCLLTKKSPGEFTKDLYDRFPNVPYAGFYVFDKPFFLPRNPELIKNILVRDFNYFSDRFIGTSPNDILGGANLFLVKNPAWKLARSKITPISTSGKLRKMLELMIEVGEDLENYLESLDLKGVGRTVEMGELCAKYTTDMIGTTAYGLKVNSLNNPDAEFRKNGRAVFTFNWWRSMEIRCLFFTPQLSKIMGFSFFTNKTSKFLRKAFWETISVRENSGIKRNDFIDLLIELKNNQTEDDKKIFDFDGDNLVAQAAIFFTGGFETASTTMTFAMYELALAPEIQKKLRDEIKKGLEENGGKITYEMVMNLPYLNMVVSETLRKFPSLPYLDRVTTADYKVPESNLVLEKGTPVYIPVLGLHHDPKYFPNPEVFDPERFSEDNKKKQKPTTYIPFGDGPHFCIAMRLGLLQTKLGIIYIISNYELSPCKETSVPLKINSKSFLTSPDGGIYLNVKKLPVAVQ